MVYMLYVHVIADASRPSLHGK